MILDIIIPVYNEESVVTTTLSRISAVEFPSPVERINVVIVDDCSTDNSREVIGEYIGREKGNFKLLKLEKNSGKGAAVRFGIANSDGDLIIIQDADLELIPDDIPAMITTMQKLDVQFVNGSRYLPGIPRPLSSYRRYLANRFMTWLTSILINVKLTDMACGYKLFYRSLYEQLDLKENRFGFEAEIIIKAMRIRKNNITEVPVHYFPRNLGEGKKISTLDGFKMLWTILKFSFWKRS